MFDINCLFLEYSIEFRHSNAIFNCFILFPLDNFEAKVEIPRELSDMQAALRPLSFFSVEFEYYLVAGAVEAGLLVDLPVEVEELVGASATRALGVEGLLAAGVAAEIERGDQRGGVGLAKGAEEGRVLVVELREIEHEVRWDRVVGGG
jgi:hypothetical protein